MTNSAVKKFYDTPYFTDRDSYLAWVAEWKKAWHATVAEIRAAKRTRGNKALPLPERWAAHDTRQALRVVAFDLLVVRKEGRERAVQARSLRLAA